MPLPKGVRSQGNKFTGYWNGKYGPSRTTVAAAKADRDLLRAGAQPSPPPRPLPPLVARNRVFGHAAGYRARRRLDGVLVEGPTRGTKDEAVADAAEFESASTLAELREKQSAMLQ